MARVAYVLGRKLAVAREKLAMTQREMGDAIGGVSDETISRVERHEVAGILAKRIPKMASTFGLSVEKFKADYCVPQMPRIANHSGLDLRRARMALAVPEFQIGVAASGRVDKLTEHPDANRLVATADRRAFTAPVDGDCQQPKWRHGETIVFSYEAVDREGILPGKSYYLAFTDGSSTFKRVFNDETDPDMFVLRCWNRKKYPDDRRVHRDEVVRIARAISKQVTVDESME